MAPRLVDGQPEVFLGYLEYDVTIVPETFKLAAARFFLHVNEEITDEVIQIREDDPYALTYYVYVDRDLRATGTCAGGMIEGFEIDIDLRRGWNSLVMNLTALTYRNEDLSEGYRWVVPGLCNGGSECPAD